MRWSRILRAGDTLRLDVVSRDIDCAIERLWECLDGDREERLGIASMIDVLGVHPAIDNIITVSTSREELVTPILLQIDGHVIPVTVTMVVWEGGLPRGKVRFLQEPIFAFAWRVVYRGLSHELKLCAGDV